MTDFEKERLDPEMNEQNETKRDIYQISETTGLLRSNDVKKEINYTQ